MENAVFSPYPEQSPHFLFSPNRIWILPVRYIDPRPSKFIPSKRRPRLHCATFPGNDKRSSWSKSTSKTVMLDRRRGNPLLFWHGPLLPLDSCRAAQKRWNTSSASPRNFSYFSPSHKIFLFFFPFSRDGKHSSTSSALVLTRAYNRLPEKELVFLAVHLKKKKETNIVVRTEEKELICMCEEAYAYSISGAGSSISFVCLLNNAQHNEPLPLLVPFLSP